MGIVLPQAPQLAGAGAFSWPVLVSWPKKRAEKPLKPPTVPTAGVSYSSPILIIIIIIVVVIIVAAAVGVTTIAILIDFLRRDNFLLFGGFSSYLFLILRWLSPALGPSAPPETPPHLSRVPLFALRRVVPVCSFLYF